MSKLFHWGLFHFHSAKGIGSGTEPTQDFSAALESSPWEADFDFEQEATVSPQHSQKCVWIRAQWP